MLRKYWVFLQGFAFPAISYFYYGGIIHIKLKIGGKIPIGPNPSLDHCEMISV